MLLLEHVLHHQASAVMFWQAAHRLDIAGIAGLGHLMELLYFCQQLSLQSGIVQALSRS